MDQRRMKQMLETERRQQAITQAALQGQLLNTITAEDSGIDLALIQWPTDGAGAELPEYGFDHAKRTSQLAVHIGLELNIPEADLKILRTAAFLHDIGRKTSWRQADPYHAERSAALADDIMRRSSWWAAEERRRAVCQLILGHHVGVDHRPQGPLATALHDADCYEAARLAPGTKEGLEVMSARHKLCASTWAQDAEKHRRWRAQYWQSNG